MSGHIQIQVKDESSEKKYFTQLPNILLRMGFSPYVITYYLVLKSIAGISPTKTCFMCQSEIADMVGCTPRHLRKMDAILEKSYAELGGKPLIIVKRQTNDKGEKMTNAISIVDIWVESITAFEKKITKIQEKKSTTKKVIKKIISAEPRSAPAEPRSAPAEPRSDIIRTIEKEISKKNENNNVRNRSSDISEPTVLFDPETFKLPNGDGLSLRMKRSFTKYSREDRQKLHANVAYFQKVVQKGAKITNYEAYLQRCINENYAQKGENSWQNQTYARFIKEEYNLHKMEILNTVVRFKRSEKEPYESISFKLPHLSFADSLEKYIEKHGEKNAYYEK